MSKFKIGYYILFCIFQHYYFALFADDTIKVRESGMLLKVIELVPKMHNDFYARIMIKT